jgi:dolichyl-phosphooligosaccharide-protein glycotransferase
MSRNGRQTTRRMPKRLSAAGVSIAILLAFGLRVVPAYRTVFTPIGVSFQEYDAWFHVHVIHNLLAHFPKRSLYDPYALFPGGENVVTGPFWDYLVGAVAWLAGAGSPSANLTDEIAAWLPAILGALLPVPVYLLARRLFGAATAMMSALWVAMIPGRFLWVGHLGMPDHHANEVFLALVNLTLLCAATEAEGKCRWILATLAGAALAAFFGTQVTGIYVPAIIAVAAVLSPSVAPVSAVAIATCCILLLPAEAISPWREYRWLSLIGALAVTAPLAMLEVMARRRRWPRALLYRRIAVVTLIAIGCIALPAAGRFHSLVRLLGSYSSGALADQVTELQPLLTDGSGVVNLFGQFGLAWLFALAGVAAFARMLARGSSPALTLFSVWNAVMIYGVFVHVRMAAYAGITVAMFAGISTVWIVRRVPLRLMWLRGVAAAGLFAAALGVSLPIVYLQTHDGSGPDPDWWAALSWLRWKTPEPLGDPGAWYRWWPRLEPGDKSVYPDSAYGVLAIWDKGWWISGIAHRIPSANGGESGAVETSRFLTETRAEDALREMRAIGARYAALSPALLGFQMTLLVRAAGHSVDEYLRFVSFRAPGGKTARGFLYLPAFYRSMAARLYLFDGRAVDTRSRGVDVYVTTEGHPSGGLLDETVSSVHHFGSASDAEHWVEEHPEQSATLGSTDLSLSCADLEQIPWMRLAFESQGEGPFSLRHPGHVKIFERTQ